MTMFGFCLTIPVSCHYFRLEAESPRVNLWDVPSGGRISGTKSANSSFYRPESADVLLVVQQPPA